MFKQSLVLTAIVSLLLVGCSSDQRYKREVDGSEDYLNSPEIKPLIVPNGMSIPPQTNDFYINRAAGEGMVGRNIDIRPPLLPLALVADSYASYEAGVVSVDLPEYANFWAQIPSLLAKHNIAVAENNNQTIKTGTRSVVQNDSGESIAATYLLRREERNGREYIKVELTSLTNNGQDISADSIQSQRYTVGLYNMLINDLPSSANTEIDE